MPLLLVSVWSMPRSAGPLYRPSGGTPATQLVCKSWRSRQKNVWFDSAHPALVAQPLGCRSWVLLADSQVQPGGEEQSRCTPKRERRGCSCRAVKNG